MFYLQNWHIDQYTDLVLQPGSAPNDCARGYFDPDHNEVVITLEPMNWHSGGIDDALHRVVMGRLHRAWPASLIKSEL
jgi:hypothetical protein